MANIQFAFVTSATAPYHRMIKFVDGVPSTDTTFPAQATPIPLGPCSFSPDGMYLVAMTANGVGTSAIRLWKLNKATMTWSVVSVGVLPYPLVAGYDIKFVNNTDIIVTDNGTSGTAGVFLGILNRANDAQTWGVLEVTYKQMGSIGILNAAGTKILITRPSVSATPYYRVYSKTSSGWAVQTVTGGITASAISLITVDLNTQIPMIEYIRQLNAVPLVLQTWQDDGADAGTITGLGTISTGDANKMTTQGTSTVVSSIALAPSGFHLAFSHNEAPYIRMMCRTNKRATPFIVGYGDVALPTGTLTVPCNSMVFVGEGLLLVAANSNVANTGRVRGFIHSNDTELLAEDTRIATLFTDWSAIPLGVASGPVIANPVAGVYDGAIDWLLNKSLTSLKMLLVTSAANFDQTNTTLAQAIGANEAYGGDWPQGGLAVAAPTFTHPSNSVSDTNVTMPLPSKDLLNAGGFTFRGAIIYDNSDANKKPLIFMRFSADQTVAQYDRLNFAASSNNVLTLKAG